MFIRGVDVNHRVSSRFNVAYKDMVTTLGVRNVTVLRKSHCVSDCCEYAPFFGRSTRSKYMCEFRVGAFGRPLTMKVSLLCTKNIPTLLDHFISQGLPFHRMI